MRKDDNIIMKIVRQTFVVQSINYGRVRSICKDDRTSNDVSLIPGLLYKGVFYETL